VYLRRPPAMHLAEMRSLETPALTDAMRGLVQPGRGYIAAKDALLVLGEVPEARIIELGSLPLGDLGQRLVALRYFLSNGKTWLRYYSWRPGLEKLDRHAPQRILVLDAFIAERRSELEAQPTLLSNFARLSLEEIGERLNDLSAIRGRGLDVLIAIEASPELRADLHARLCREAKALLAQSARATDLLYLATYDLTRFPATTVGGGDLMYIIVADKGEMGTRAVREAARLGHCPVVLFSKADDDNALQVRLCHEHGGFAIPLEGTFRESYASYEQIARKVLEAYERRFGENAKEELGRSALYPGYGPLAENTAAIEHFRRNGIAFIGPMQDVVERAGDKRKFRGLAESIDPKAVVPGIVMSENDATGILTRVREGFAEGRFGFPGRLKAANGGGGRGQVVIPNPEQLEDAVRKVLGEIKSNGWDAGVMFEQNIPETIHLEVQVVRDRFGNTRHFGMRDCSEQRASQKIQEEAPPALLRKSEALEDRITTLAVRIADAVGYVGACTVELMYKDGHFYLLEMNTRIQVEHPVTEAAYRIRNSKGELEPLNLVELQYWVAAGRVIPFAQTDVIKTHVAREFRINAESWNADLKDSRDGKKGLFMPNAGEFTAIELPTSESIRKELESQGLSGLGEVLVRLDSGFEPGDRLLNKDPTFAKLIVSVRVEPGNEDQAYEILRLASLATLKKVRIEGMALLPSGKVQEGVPFRTNIPEHIAILSSAMLQEHSRSMAKSRHVNWVVGMLRNEK
jgi:acetyl/propionyl-CoA carboxylase alpha subunit